MLRRNKTIQKCVWAALIAFVIAWLAFLFFQRGHPWDEGEHAHAAWLISQGKRPLDDFFQHHQPLLWSLLALYFRVGLTGPAVLIWGRVLVVLSGLISVFALVRLGRLHHPSSQRFAGWLGAVAFVGLTVMLPTLFVIRPETISAAAFLAAFAIWNEPTTRRWDTAMSMIAGVLAGASVYSSPRYALLGGLFALSGAQSFRRWFGLAGGGIGFIAAYTVLSGFTLDKVVFNVEFSAFLQTIGTRLHGFRPAFWDLLLAVVCSFMTALLIAMPRHDRWRGAALVAYVVVVFVLCRHFSGLFQYAQAYAPFVTAAAIACAWIGAKVQWTAEPPAVLATIAAGIVLGHGLSQPLLAVRMPPLDFLAFVRFREQLGESIPRGATILVNIKDSPITIADASYYAFPLWDSQNRLCRAVSEFRSRRKLPPCDYLKTLLDAKPYLIAEPFKVIVPKMSAQLATAVVNKYYRPVFTVGGSTSRVRTGVMRRVDGMRDGEASWAAVAHGKVGLQ